MSLLHNDEPFCGYTVQYLIKTGAFAETYRIADAEGKSFFLKLLDTTALPESMLNEEGEPSEIAISRKLEHPAIIRFREAGHVEIEGKRRDYLITDYLQGELVAERLQRETRLPVATALSIATRILDGLEYLHGRIPCLTHNDVTARNIMFDTAEDGQLRPYIIDLGHTAPPCSGNAPFPTGDLEPVYRAPETFLGIYNCATDVFSVGVLLYRMLFGTMPWTCDLEGCTPAEVKKRLREARAQELVIPAHDVQDPINDAVTDALRRALSPGQSGRFTSARKFREALAEENTASENRPVQKEAEQKKSKNDADQTTTAQEATHTAAFKKGKGNGFADVAGMDDLKDHLRKKVINILCDKEKAIRYRLNIPNGMLLYGPPGCGKTFIAEKFAEETGFNYTIVNSSDLSSIYIHGSQQMIGSLFREARQKAPTIICFDEFDALVPNRKGIAHSGQSGEVNEFLSQLNNCGKDNIFVIATSNRPEMIDPAVLRTGRIDRLVYVPMPDADARKALFALNLKGRPCEEIDLNELAGLTENYVASDIAYLVNDAATTAAFADVPINSTILLETLGCMRPSLSREVLAEYESLRQRMEQGVTRERTRIGYKP